jgi:hypothetical protein
MDRVIRRGERLQSNEKLERAEAAARTFCQRTDELDSARLPDGWGAMLCGAPDLALRVSSSALWERSSAGTRSAQGAHCAWGHSARFCIGALKLGSVDFVPAVRQPAKNIALASRSLWKRRQSSAPRAARERTIALAAGRWGAGRALAAYQAAIAGGIAIGSWIWGSAAGLVGVKGALLASSAALIFSSLLGIWMRMPTVRGPNEQSRDLLEDPEVRLSLTSRSGPIVVEIEYRVSPKKARLFYAVMQHVQLSHKRNGAYGWPTARNPG